MIYLSDPEHRLPTAEQLPSSDDTPVDNQLQNDIPNLLLQVLADLWAQRDDWYFGIDMAIYYDPNQPAIVPDAFLAVGVQRFVGDRGRLSYVLWQEQVVPLLVLEIISEKYSGEYDSKMAKYAAIGIPYYFVYNLDSGRKGRFRLHQRLEVYRLTAGGYQLQDTPHQRLWLPEICLGLGVEVAEQMGWQREWFFWYNQRGDRYLTPPEKAQRLAQKLQKLGINPDHL